MYKCVLFYSRVCVPLRLVRCSCLYGSRQCARGEQGSEKDAAAVEGGGKRGSTRPRGPPLVDSLTDDMH